METTQRKNKCIDGKCTSSERGAKDCDYRVTFSSNGCKMELKGCCMNKEAQLNEVKDERDEKIEELSNLLAVSNGRIDTLLNEIAFLNSSLRFDIIKKDSVIEFLWSKIKTQ